MFGYNNYDNYFLNKKINNTACDVMTLRITGYLESLVRELVKLPKETEWVEFKCNNKKPQMIGEYISSLTIPPFSTTGRKLMLCGVWMMRPTG